MMGALEIRPVRPSEYEQAGAIVVKAYRALPGEVLSGGYEAELADVGARVGDTEVLVAVDGGAIVGCVTFVADSTSPWAEGVAADESSVRMLAVDPEHQGGGVGRALLDGCLTRAVALGRAAMFFHSTPWMTAAHRLYERAGFRRVPERDWTPIPEVPLLAFRLDLTTEKAAP
jgi:ribosomal protein S18 acetylase RimI-like enzyme